MSGDIEGAAAWIPRAHPRALALGDAHVWLADVGDLRPALDQFAASLSDDEQEHGARYMRAEDRERSTLARGLLRRLLGEYLGAHPANLRFRVGPQGKPALAEPSPQSERPLAFNLAHSGSHIALAFTHARAVGVDVERIRDQSAGDMLAATFFSAQERAALNALSGEERLRAFYTCWTRKEAYLKATGEGLSAPLNSFSVPLTPIPLTQPYRIADSSSGRPRWTLHDLAPILGYAAALALAATHRPARVTCWRYRLPERADG